MLPPAGTGTVLRSQSGLKKSSVGVNAIFGVLELAVSTSSAKSICILLPLPQPPAAVSAEMIAAELEALAVALTSVLKNIDVAKYGPVAEVTLTASCIVDSCTVESSAATLPSPAPSPLSIESTPHAAAHSENKHVVVARMNRR